MKLISLWQPWATLMAIGEKAIETRDWSTEYRGHVAIHATLTWNADCQVAACRDEFVGALVRHVSSRGDRHWLKTLRAELPFGQIVAVGNLIDSAEMWQCDFCDGCGWYEGGKTLQTTCPDCAGLGLTPKGHKLSRTEASFGKYEPGRYGLVFTDVFRLPEPIPFKSRQGKLLDIDPILEGLIQQQWRHSRAS